jgi:hypothetical protein
MVEATDEAWHGRGGPCGGGTRGQARRRWPGQSTAHEAGSVSTRGRARRRAILGGMVMGEPDRDSSS